jgi:hypothetical protein
MGQGQSVEGAAQGAEKGALPAGSGDVPVVAMRATVIAHAGVAGASGDEAGIRDLAAEAAHGKRGSSSSKPMTKIRAMMANKMT